MAYPNTLTQLEVDPQADTPSDPAHLDLHRTANQLLMEIQAAHRTGGVLSLADHIASPGAHGALDEVLAPAPSGSPSVDLAQLQALITANPGRVIRLRRGLYYLRGLRLDTPGTSLVGAPGWGTELRLSGATWAAMIIIGADDCAIRGFILDGNRSAYPAGQGYYWTGLIEVDTTSSRKRISIEDCWIRNTTRSGILAIGGTSRSVRELSIRRNRFSNIGNYGTNAPWGNGGAGAFLQDNIQDLAFEYNVTAGGLSSNLLKLWSDVDQFGSAVTSKAALIAHNLCNYSDMTGTNFDTEAGVLALECAKGCWYTRMLSNFVYGPADSFTPGGGANIATAYFFGLSHGYGPGTTIGRNVVIKSGASNAVIAFAIECAESPGMVCTDNVAWGAVTGTNVTAGSIEAGQGTVIADSVYWDMADQAIVASGGANYLSLENLTLVDFGKIGVFLNQADAQRDVDITKCRFLQRDQTALHAEGVIYGIYIYGTGGVKYRTKIALCRFGPMLGGTSTVPFRPINANAPDAIEVVLCDLNGAAPTGTAKEDWAMTLFGGDNDVAFNYAQNFNSGLAAVAATPASRFAFNKGPVISVSYGTSGQSTNLYVEGGLLKWRSPVNTSPLTIGT